jgi:hypothetical protein
MTTLTGTVAEFEPPETVRVVDPPVVPTAVTVKIPLVDDAGVTVTIPAFALVAV